MKKQIFRKCINRNCGVKFEPKRDTHVVCSTKCGVEYAKTITLKYKKKKENEWKIEKKARKEKLKTRKDHLTELQRLFNKFIRLRDRHKGCISCGTELKGKYDAGHFLSVGAYPNLRFNEDNNHGQCVHCNQHKHGNTIEYQIGLIERIGKDAFDRLMDERRKPLKLTLPEILDFKEHYKIKIKTFN